MATRHFVFAASQAIPSAQDFLFAHCVILYSSDLGFHQKVTESIITQTAQKVSTGGSSFGSGPFLDWVDFA